MPFLLAVDVTSLALSLAIGMALVIIVAGSGIRKPLNLSFALFTLMGAGWAGATLLMRLSLWFHLGDATMLMYLALACFEFMAPFLLLFVARFTRLRASWPKWTALAVGVESVVHTIPLIGGALVHHPSLEASGAAVYVVSAWGYASAAIPGACVLLALGLLWVRRRHTRQPIIAVSITFLLAGFLLGALPQVRLPLMSIANTVAVSILGWGIMRRQIFNPLQDLTADLQKRAHRQELIAEISRRTTTLLPLDELLLQAATLIRDSFDYFTVGILLVEGEELVLRASTLASIQALSNKFRLKIGAEGICGWVAASGRPLLVGDVRRERRYVELVDNVRTRSELAVPISRGDRVVGVLDVQSVQLDAFNEEDLVTQQTIADQLSNAMENARLYEQTRRRAERLALVNRISTAAGAVLDLGDLLETVHREVTPIFEADAFFIALYDAQANELDYRIQVDEGMREPHVREPLGDGYTSRVVTLKKPLLANDMKRAHTDGPRPQAWGTGKIPSSWMGVPMLIGQRIIGVLSVQTYRPHLYDEEDLLLAATIADQVAIAVENARLYEEVRLELSVRQRTEKGLRESEEKFRNLSEQSPNMIFIWGQGRVMYANRQCELSMGYTRDEFYAPGFNFQSLTAPGYEAVVSENFRRHTGGEEAAPYEYALITRAGRRIDTILTTKLMRYGGEPAILGIITDITTRKRTERLLQSLNAAALAMEQALTPAEIFPAAALALASLGLDSAVFLTDAEDPRRLCAHCRGSGLTAGVRNEEKGHSAEQSFVIDAVPAVADAMDRRGAVFTTLDPATVALLLGSDGTAARPGHSPEPRAAVLAPLSVGEDLFGLLIVSGNDLAPEEVQVFTAFSYQAAAAWRKTRLMRDLEGSLQKLRQTQEQLLHAQKMEAIGRLAGGIAHDFNNLLTVISGYTSLLVDSLEGNPPALSDLDQIRNTIKRASALTSRLLAFSRKQILQPTVLDVNKVVANSVTLLRPLIGEDIDLVVRLTPASVSVRADYYQMEQILMNLAVNARDAMPGGGKLVLETARLEVSADGTVSFQGIDPGFEAVLPLGMGPGPWVLLRVRDNGVGMSEETCAHLFEPFFTTKDEGKGSGLGLSTVYGIVSHSSGLVRVESALGRGSTFTICLPSVPPLGEQSATADLRPPPRGGSGTILLVEDEADVRELARRVLEKGGYQVIPVSSAREALLVAEGSAVIHAIVTDVVMPGGMSGIEMGERLGRSRPSLPVLYMSGYTDDIRIHAPATAGQIPFLAKPFQPAELLSKVQELLRRP